MMIIKKLMANLKVEGKESVYNYRVTKGELKGKDAYGLEVERIDYVNNQEVKIEREKIEYISPELNDVIELANKLHKYIVSPIHVVDIIGEEVDNLGYKFDDQSYVCA